MSVIFRNETAPGESVPLPIDWDEAEITAVVVLMDSALSGDRAWLNYVRELSQNARAETRRISRTFPIIMEAGDHERLFGEQALRWDRWEGSDAKRKMRLVRDLTNEFSRMLRQRLGRQMRASPESLSRKIQVFISHTKRDGDGESIALDIRDWLHEHSALASFFDIIDIPAGLPFEEILLNQVGSSAVIALHTDSYSSSEWCRREVIEAKRHHVPMVIVDCLRDIDQQSIPYMGNVPVVRMSPDKRDRIDIVTGRLLEEVFRTYLWHCRIERYAAEYPHILFMARPPELISLATLLMPQSESGSTIVHPEPVLMAVDAQLFSEIAPNVHIQTLTEWLEAS